MEMNYILRVPTDKDDKFCQGDYRELFFNNLEKLVIERDKFRLKGYMAYRSV